MIRRMYSIIAIIVCSIASAALLTACGGGGGPKGSNQDPDPVVQDVPLAYVVRAVPAEGEEASRFLDLDGFFPGSKLILRNRAAPKSAEKEIPNRLFGEGDLYDVKDLEVSYDGTKLLFALRGPVLAQLEEGEVQPETWWNLWQYDIASDELTPVMTDDMANTAHDIGGAYLPDGRIIFASTRQHRTKAILLDEGKPQYTYQTEDTGSEDPSRTGDTFVLHTLELDDNGNPLALQQVTFNQSHDFDPTVLQSGKVVFSRWDNYGSHDVVSLYQMNPDGSGMELYYGYNSHETGNSVRIPFCSEVSDLIDAQAAAQLAAEEAAAAAAGEGETPEPVEPAEPILCVPDPVPEEPDTGDGTEGDGTEGDGAEGEGTDSTDGDTVEDDATDAGDEDSTDDDTATDDTADEEEPLVEPTIVHFTQTRQLPDGRLLALLRSFDSAQYETELITIDAQNFVDNDQVLPAGSAASVVAQSNYTSFVVNSDGSFTGNGRFTSVFPLFDGTNRAVVGWAPCRLEVFPPVVAAPEEPAAPEEDPVEENEETEEEGEEPAPEEPAEPEVEPVGKIQTCLGENLSRPDVQGSEASMLFGLWMFDLSSNTQTPINVFPEGSNQLYSEVVVIQARSFPTVIQNVTISTDTFDPTCQPALFEIDDGYAAINIRSVYDIDGVFDVGSEFVSLGTTTERTIAEIADPSITTWAERRARFLRIEKPVAIPTNDVVNVPGYALGDGSEFMREIVGYARIEPDGSVFAKVPADIPFTLSVVDDFGRRLNRTRHQNWMQLRPGEVMQCNGCHEADSTVPHGRAESRPVSLNLGAPTSELEFPNTNPNLYVVQRRDGVVGETTCLPEIGETMAEVHARLKPEEVPLSQNLNYKDDWTIAAAPAEGEEAVSEDDVNLTYNGFETPQPYNNPSCDEKWDVFCRTVINYPDHIQPIWEKSRPQEDADGNAIMVNGEPLDYRCTNCHFGGVAMDSSGEPKEQLDLTREPSEGGVRFQSYIELIGDNFVFVENAVGELTSLFNVLDPNNVIDLNKVAGEYLAEYIDGQQVSIIVETFQLDENGEFALDGDGDFIPLTFHILESALDGTRRMVGARALDNFAFHSVFQPESQVFNNFSFDHTAPDILTENERRLLWEWLDIGWQYYNNPFDIPED